MGAAAGGASVASAGLTMASSIMSGMGTQSADNFQASELEEKAQIGQAQATEVTNNLTQKLNLALGNIDAVRAAGHDDPTSPTALALRNTTASRQNLAKTTQVGNILSQSEMDASNADYLKQAGSYALTQSIVAGAAGAAGKVAQTNFSSFGTGSS